jgi:hypothetical protein
VNPPRLTPDQRLERAIAFLARLQYPGSRGAGDQRAHRARGDATRARIPAWDEILAALIGVGEELRDEQAREGLTKQVNAASDRCGAADKQPDIDVRRHSAGG